MSKIIEVPSSLVSVDWLQENSNAQNLIIFDATIAKVGSTNKQETTKELIPNALFFDIKNTFSDLNSAYPNTLLHPDEFEFKVQNLGVNKGSCIVVYDDLGIYSSPRVWWMFQVFGFKNIAVLNGGLPAWKNAKLPTGSPKFLDVKKGDFLANYQPDKVRFTDDVLTAISSSSCIVDARSNKRFLGVVPEPRKEVRSGHIPSSINIPYTDLLMDGKMKSVNELKSIFNTISLTNNEFVFSCGSGITACILALGADLAGYFNNAVYDGSWSEWGSRTDLPIKSLHQPNWTLEEFETYVLLFCAQSNHIETEEERDYISKKVDEKLFNAIHTEIVHDTHIESIEKIKIFLSENSYSSEEKRRLIKEIKNVFFVDGTVDKLEIKVFKILQNILE